MSHVPRPLDTVSRPFGWLACALLLVTTVTAANAPTWWQTRGVLQTNATPNDYAALNVGQLKQIAFSAWQELETLPGGAGFQPSFTNAANNFAAVNIGQLKAVAQPCYNRLIALGLATNYPWTNCQSTNNYAIANIGQAKKLFSFFLDQTIDTDGDGMPNIWEYLYGFDWSVWQTDNIHGPGDDADSDGLVNTQELAYATSPISMDTDNDRLTDLQEVRAGTDPRNPDSDQDGLSDLTELRSNQIMVWGTNNYGQCTVPDSVTNVIAVAGGSSFSLALRSDRTIANWGQNINIPSSATNVAAIAGGYMHGLALRRDGKVISWGYNNYGQTNVPVTLPAAVAIAAGSLHSVALCSDGRVIAWGDNTYGQRNVPARATPSIGLAAGLFHNLALRADGTVVAWGGTGFLNHGQTNVPASAINVVAIAGGGYHSLALLKDGTVVAWGDNTYGQCSVPASATDVVAIAAGQFHSFALCRDGKVVAWGDNDGGECAGASNVISGASIASGWHHGLVIPHRTDPLKWDTDNDTIPDGWEISHGLDPRNSADASQDTDNDGLINSEEYLNNTNPYNVDTDGDGYSDSWEVENGFNPTDQSDIDADTDGDGLTNINEFFLGTNRTAFDTDNDGLSDGIESTPMYLTLWDENGDTGKLYPNLQVAQVTASDTARAARLKDGQVIIFTGSCTNMLAYTNDCGAAKIDATESWIAAVLTNGNVKVWREVNGALTEFSLGSTNAVDISGGFQHLLVLYKNGSVTCLNKDGSGAPVAYANLFCLSVNTNALSISVGGNADAVILKNRTTALLGSVYDTAFEPAITTLSNGLAVAVSAGINHNFVVQFANGSARAYLPIAYGTIYGIYYRYKEVLIPSGVVSIAAGGSSNMVAVLSNGSNAVFKYGGTNWNTATLTNQLTDAKDLWWRRGCNLAVTGAGELLPLAASSTSGRQLAYRMAAMTPGGAGRGIAAACLGTSATKNDSDGDNLSDGWEFYGGINPLSTIGIDGQQGDPDGDGLSNFDEYLNGTCPIEKDTDGDTVSDKVEVEQGSNPLDKSDNGIPPPASELVEIPFTVGDPSGSHSERWQMNIKSLGPTDTRAFYFVNETFGTVGTKNFKLRKGNSYEITLQHQATASGNTTDFDWQAQIGGLPSTSVLEGGKVHPTATRFSSRSDLNILIDNEDGLLGVVDQSFETPNHTIGKKAKLHVMKAAFVPDYDRDGKILEADCNLANTGKKFTFWLNDDKDDGDFTSHGKDTPSTDFPGQMGGNDLDSVVNGRSDLLDFTPIWLDLKDVMKILPPGGANKYRIRSKGANFVQTNLSREEIRIFHRSSYDHCGTNLNEVSSSASVLPAASDANEYVTELSPVFLAAMQADGNKGVLMVEGVSQDASLVLEVLATSGVVMLRYENMLRFVSVESMYRWVNLRSVTGGSEETPTKAYPPLNYPDSECNGKHFIFVHGLNVNEHDARCSGAEMFKRLYQSGSKAMYTAVAWHGTQGQEWYDTPYVGRRTADYYGNVMNAFNTAAALSNAVSQLPGKKIISAHSLGNMVVSSAIHDHGLAVEKYFMFNAAVASETLDEGRFNTTAVGNPMVHDDWRTYLPRTWASCWNELFNAETDDRGKLTWKKRFSGVLPIAYNYYSSRDEAFETYKKLTLFGDYEICTPVPIDGCGNSRASIGRYSWQKQELYKGRDNSADLVTSWVAANDTAGWGFKGSLTVRLTGEEWTPDFDATSANGLSLSTLMVTPVFFPTPPEMFNATLGKGLQNGVLAYAIPSLSTAIGHEEVNPTSIDNINMNNDIAHPNGWWRLGLGGDQGPGDLDRCWLHSDMFEVAYYYVYTLFDDFVTRGGLK
jgi:hypothetical protein